jgi:VIT1/CCC1 family predicted Fe2+/Mn2+ transporter
VRTSKDEKYGRDLVRRELVAVFPRATTDEQAEAIRARIVALDGVPAKPELDGRDALAAVAIFLIVVAATFPVVLPFALFTDVETAKWTSRGLSLGMLFAGGLALGNYAGYGSWKAGLMMVGLGTALTVAIVALGG